MNIKAYPTDMSNEEWVVASPPLNSMTEDSSQPQSSSVFQLPWKSLKTNFTSYNPALFTFALPASQVSWLRNRMQEVGFDERTLLLAAFNVLLYRYTQQETIALALTVLKPQATKSGTVEFHTQTHGQCQAQDLISHISTHLEQVSQQIDANFVPSENNGHSSDLAAPSIAVTFVEPSVLTTHESRFQLDTEPSKGVSQPDWHLILNQEEQGITGTLQYNANLFTGDTIQRVVGHWQMLVEGMANRPTCPIAQLPLLTPAERHQLTVAWESASVAYPAIPIHQSIENHAAQKPEAIAVTFKESQLSYQELNQRANLLAHYLIKAGVGAEVRVAMCLEPSLDVAVCLLAILKAGGVYVPLDPTHPKERLATILEDNQPQVLLTQSYLLPTLPTIATTQRFCLDQDWQRIQSIPVHNPSVEIDLDQTAYLVYTSGTTGKPKGVMASHRNLMHYILSARDRYGFNQQDVMPAIARSTFSINLFELLTPLVAGGQLLILERDQILNFKRMVQVLQQVTIIHASPSLWRKLLPYILENEVDTRQFHQLRHVSAGGDMVPADLLELMKSLFPNAEVFVIYGCSEISCMGCTYPVLRDRTVTKTWVGKPFNNVTVRLFDAYQNLVPIGLPGEIYFGGTGVTTGYLNREELTQEKFITIDGQRFYRTGDLGRFDTDGNLEILGRSDFQIKLRGIRIEPAEIEANLRQAPGVRDGVVVARELNNSEKSLVAYIVLEQSEQPKIESIRQFLETKLPDYMIPAAFVVLDALPVNVNQKVDRSALPAPTTENIAGLKTIVPARNDWESQLIEIWESTLGIQPIGIQNNFFELGGDSLQAVQILMQIEKRWNKTLPITLFLETPTVETLARVICNDAETIANSNVALLRSGGNKPPLFCLYGLFVYRDLANNLDTDQPIYGVALQEEVDLIKADQYDPTKLAFFTVPGLAARYLESIRSVQPHGPYYLAGYSFGGVIAFEMAQQLQAAGEEVPLVVLIDSMLLGEIDKKITLQQRLKSHWDGLLKNGAVHLLKRLKARLGKMHHQIMVQQQPKGKTYLFNMAERLLLLLFRGVEFIELLADKWNHRVPTVANESSQVTDTSVQNAVLEEEQDGFWWEICLQASRIYKPQPYSGNVVLLQATISSASSSTVPVDFSAQWRPLITGDFEAHVIPGDHASIITPPQVSRLAQLLQPYLLQ